MTKYPHGLTLQAVCYAIDAYREQEDVLPEAGMIAAFEILLAAMDKPDLTAPPLDTYPPEQIEAYISNLQQRAEAAEAVLKEEEHATCAVRREKAGYAREVARLEAKLAELEKQDAYVEIMKDGPVTICHWMKPAEALPDGAKLFTRPAPAVSLAETVPECFNRLFNHASGLAKGVDWNKGTAARNHREHLCIAVIECREFLRNIEEAKNK